jgi:hypothetical protein
MIRDRKELLRMDPQDLDRLAREMFTRSGFDHLTSGTQGRASAILQQLVDEGGSSRTNAKRIMEYLCAQLLGIQNSVSHNTRDLARSLANRLDLTPDDLLPQPHSEPRRLDFDLGRELLGDDALLTDVVPVDVNDESTEARGR